MPVSEDTIQNKVEIYLHRSYRDKQINKWSKKGYEREGLRSKGRLLLEK